jgi:hypothetical protein
MCIARHDDIEMFPSLSQQYPLEFREAFSKSIQHVAKIEPDIEGDLVISASARVEFSAQRTDQFRQPTFNGHVNVFILSRKAESPFIELELHSFQSPDQGFRLLSRKDVGALHGPAMRDATLNIVRIEPAIKRQ